MTEKKCEYNSRPGNQSALGHGAPKGNQNARRAKLIRNALKDAFIELEGGAEDDDVKLQRRLRKYARGLIKLAEDGDVSAYKEINDRLDGKAVQPIAGDEDSPPVQIGRIERVIVDAVAEDTDSPSIPATH